MSIATEIEQAIPALHRYARSLVPQRPDADDLVQDCLVRAFSRLPEAGAQATVLPWLFTILHNLSVSRWRRLARWGRTVDLADAGLATPPAQDWAPTARDLLRGFERLSPEHRQVLLLVSVEGLDYRAAAAVLGVPTGTVMSRLSRARDALRDHMDGTGGAARPHRRPALRRVK